MQICSGGADPCASTSRCYVFGLVRINLVFTLQFDQRWNFIMDSSCVALNSGFITSHSVQNTHGYHVATTSFPCLLFFVLTTPKQSLRSCCHHHLMSCSGVAGALHTQHNPASRCLHRSSVSRIGNAAARGAASCKQSFFWKRSTDGGDRCEAAERTIHVQHVKGARSQTRNSQTGITLQCLAYCTKEHSHQSTCSLCTGGNLADVRSLELPQWNPPASWSLPWALRVASDLYVAAKLSQF